MFNTEKEIIDVCKEKGKRIYELVIEEEIRLGKTTEAEVRRKLSETLSVMEESATANLSRATESKFNMIDGFAKKAAEFGDKGQAMVGSLVMKAMAMALSTSEVNCSMGKIVAAPTAGSAGILPAAMIAAKEFYMYDEETLQNGLLTSIAIGKLIGKYATFAGAEGGCQAECGSAAAMAAAALVEMRGGTPAQCLAGASICFVNVMGLVCDPIAGLVQYPCAFRNSSGVVNAMTSADLALAGIHSIVPFDEVLQAVNEVGSSIKQELRETGTGGLAATHTGNRIRKAFLENKG